MGYDLHIVRKADPEDFDMESDITLEEWLAYIDKDPELVISTTYRINDPDNPGGDMPAPGFCEWLTHPTNQNPDSLPWLLFYRGDISSKYPDAPLVHKMVSIARALGGWVQGDDGELYDETYTEQLPVYLPKKPWWKFW